MKIASGNVTMNSDNRYYSYGGTTASMGSKIAGTEGLTNAYGESITVNRVAFSKYVYETSTISAAKNSGESVAALALQSAKDAGEDVDNADSKTTSMKDFGLAADIFSGKSLVSGTSSSTSSYVDGITNFRIRLIQIILGMLDNSFQSSGTQSLLGTLNSQLSEMISGGTSSGFISATSASYEEEETNFSAQGKAITEDGREIDFNVGFGLSRSFASYTNIQTDMNVSFTDPLVINVGSDVTEVSDQKFMFDLDCDGQEEKISKLCGDSGFLAIDKNNDGKINDGSELFGTKSGDGFKDLSLYDEDGNGFIDENDSVWDSLRVWMKNDSGEDELLTLKNADVGAIYLGKSATSFDMNSLDGQTTNGRLQSSGVYLKESGGAGIIQDIDLAVG